jgi:hypothetical protein
MEAEMTNEPPAPGTIRPEEWIVHPVSDSAVYLNRPRVRYADDADATEDRSSDEESPPANPSPASEQA